MAIKKIVMKTKNTKPKSEKNKKNDYQSIKTEFEKNHVKIINKSFFIKFDKDKHVIMTKNKLICSYEHLSYTLIVQDQVKQKQFITS